MKQRVWSVLKWLPLVFVLVVAFYLFVFDGWKDLVRGRSHRMAQEMFPLSMDMNSELDDADEARIYVLAGEDEKSIPKEKFTLGRWGRSYGCYGSVVLRGRELDSFMHAFDTQQVGQVYTAMCHGPVYGFRIYRNGRLLREAAVCWSCSNFSFSLLPGLDSGSGFNSRSKQAIELFEFCAARLPFEGHELELEKLRGNQ